MGKPYHYQCCEFEKGLEAAQKRFSKDRRLADSISQMKAELWHPGDLLVSTLDIKTGEDELARKAFASKTDRRKPNKGGNP